MVSGDRKNNVFCGSSVPKQVKRDAAFLVVTDILCTVVGIRRASVSDDAAVKPVADLFIVLYI